MKAAKSPIPEGHHTVTPSLTLRNAVEAVEFYKKALGAKERMRMTGPDGKIMHGELQIGDSIVFFGEEMPNMGNKSPLTLGGSTGGLYLYVDDVDKSFQQAIRAGGKETMPVADMFWGDRYGQFTDPYGYTWGIATHTKDMTEEEIRQGQDAFFAQMSQAQRKSA